MNARSSQSANAANTRRCPICGKPPVERYRPFCSKRCADIDLNRWLSGTYVVPAAEHDDEAEEPEDDRERD
jgi:endogenous inhibitor of DNA gyrase (YacG/DUF329 family)